MSLFAVYIDEYSTTLMYLTNEEVFNLAERKKINEIYTILKGNTAEILSQHV